MSTKFFTNSQDRNLFDKFKGIIECMKDLYAFHAVVGYFRSSGYFALQPYIKNLPSIKILVGINVDQGESLIFQSFCSLRKITFVNYDIFIPIDEF